VLHTTSGFIHGDGRGYEVGVDVGAAVHCAIPLSLAVVRQITSIEIGTLTVFANDY